MTASHEHNTELCAQLERITAAPSARCEVLADNGDVELRDAWLGLDQVLSIYAPKESTLSVECVATITRTVLRGDGVASSRPEVFSRSWPWVLAGSILLCAVTVGEFFIPHARDYAPVNDNVANTRPQASHDEFQWEDALDDVVSATASDAAAVWQSLDGGESLELTEALDLIEEDLETSTL